MTKINDGGPAFPEAIAVSPSGDVYPGMGGMSLRDYFAAQAIAGMGADIMFRMRPKDVITRALEIADAMLAERERGK